MKVNLFCSGGPRKRRDYKIWSTDWCSRPRSNNSTLCPAVWQKAITAWPSTTSLCSDCPSVQPAVYLFLHWVSSKGKNSFVNTVNNWSGFRSPPHLMASLGCFVPEMECTLHEERSLKLQVEEKLLQLEKDHSMLDCDYKQAQHKLDELQGQKEKLSEEVLLRQWAH